MSKVNRRKIIVGIVFILLSLFCGLTAFYFFEVKPKLAGRKKVKLGAKKISGTSEEKQVKLRKKVPIPPPPPKSVEPTSPEPVAPASLPEKAEEKKDINLQVLVKEAESVYDEKERARRRLLFSHTSLVLTT